MNNFLIILWCVTKSGCYIITGNDQLCSWPEEQLQSTSQSQSYTHTHTKGHGHCLVVCCWLDPLQLSESQRNHCIWKVCAANHWDAPKTATPAASTGQKKRPNFAGRCPTTHHTTNASKTEQTGLWNLTSSTIFTRSPANHLPLPSSILTSFCKENAFHT